MIIYDCEIKKAILNRGEDPIPDIEYCDGWRDFDNMGISVIGCYDYDDERYRVFLDDNFDEFRALTLSTDIVIGFDSHLFDDKLCAAHDISIDHVKSYDLLAEIWRAAGLGPHFNPRTHGGYGLDACSAANFGTQKTGHGALAPVDWQRGNYGRVIDYCLNDVKLTKQLVDRILLEGHVVCPNGRGLLHPVPPGGAV